MNYKAKRADGKGWVDGYPVPSKSGNVIAIYEYIDICEDYEDDEVGAIAPYHTVVPETVCRSTGLIDCNKKFGFNGDNVSHKGYGDGVIEWDEKSAKFYINFISFKGSMTILKKSKLTGRNVHDKS